MLHLSHSPLSSPRTQALPTYQDPNSARQLTSLSPRTPHSARMSIRRKPKLIRHHSIAQGQEIHHTITYSTAIDEEAHMVADSALQRVTQLLANMEQHITEEEGRPHYIETSVDSTLNSARGTRDSARSAMGDVRTPLTARTRNELDELRSRNHDLELMLSLEMDRRRKLEQQLLPNRAPESASTPTRPPAAEESAVQTPTQPEPTPTQDASHGVATAPLRTYRGSPRYVLTQSTYYLQQSGASPGVFSRHVSPMPTMVQAPMMYMMQSGSSPHLVANPMLMRTPPAPLGAPGFPHGRVSFGSSPAPQHKVPCGGLSPQRSHGGGWPVEGVPGLGSLIGPAESMRRSHTGSLLGVSAGPRAQSPTRDPVAFSVRRAVSPPPVGVRSTPAPGPMRSSVRTGSPPPRMTTSPPRMRPSSSVPWPRFPESPPVPPPGETTLPPGALDMMPQTPETRPAFRAIPRPTSPLAGATPSSRASIGSQPRVVPPAGFSSGRLGDRSPGRGRTTPQRAVAFSSVG
mmetsp:Transcript_50674/g.115155  ORF Transcript_50674/g.115155 Transcript_50674/m.115155 type:complete len:516 (+) Transcript_50674:276-1823(+)